MTGWLRSAALDALAHPWMSRALASRGGARSIILMLHRFRSADHGVFGHDPAGLHKLLATLRRNRIALVDVEQAIATMSGAEDTSRGLSVAFTVDDGYADLVEIGGPVFAEFDCPVTGFVVPGIVEGDCWYWWDQIDWIMRQTARRALALELGEDRIQLCWSDVPSRGRVVDGLVERLKQLDHDVLLRCVAQLADEAEVSVSIPAPSRYRVLSWDELRSAETHGMRFGAHSMTHPVLSRCTHAQSAYEIGESVRRVNVELARPSTVFCYPNGQADDFGEAEISAVRAAGLAAALSSLPAAPDARHPDWRFAVPRFSYMDHAGTVISHFLR